MRPRPMKATCNGVVRLVDALLVVMLLVVMMIDPFESRDLSLIYNCPLRVVEEGVLKLELQSSFEKMYFRSVNFTGFYGCLSKKCRLIRKKRR